MTPFILNILKIGVAYAVVAGGPAGTPPAAPDTFIANFYQFALMAGGVLAFGVIVYAAVKYALSAGNPSIQSDAKDQITQALLGLLLLLGAYIVLNTINPDLTKLRLPTLNPIPPPPSGIFEQPTGTKVVCLAATAICYSNALTCRSNCPVSSHCEVVDSSYPCQTGP